MAGSKTHTWISLWFLITAPIIFWDVGYCLMRPRSFKGGDLHWIWNPYALYQEVDLVYGVDAYYRGDGFTNAQASLNIVETLLNLYYLYSQHILSSPSAPLVGFASAVMTLSKTILYWAQEYYCGGCAVGHNDLNTLFWLWIVPNGLWIVVPTFIVATLAKDISRSLFTRIYTI
ncbi:protein related to Adiponectin receptor 1 [Pyrrhoderma noxium]|uniref:Protein related to Adiponectin receptor 1 n=1 Tax=Pyrrhoderma noxium TaxID=2282107 RepID=A0A286UBP7_9AGAM|nr:protein related to Adiponectin receptor 1 [Pyrrhoderma noxium]